MSDFWQCDDSDIKVFEKIIEANCKTAVTDYVQNAGFFYLRIDSLTNHITVNFQIDNNKGKTLAHKHTLLIEMIENEIWHAEEDDDLILADQWQAVLDSLKNVGKKVEL